MFFQYDWFLLLSVADLPILSSIQAIMDVIKTLFPSIVNILFIFNLKDIILGGLIATYVFLLFWLLYGWLNKIFQRISQNVIYDENELQNLSSEDHTPAPIVENVENIIEPLDELHEEEEEVNEPSKRISGRIGLPGFTRLSSNLE